MQIRIIRRRYQNMASHNDSDSDSELIFEDAVEDITTSEQIKNKTTASSTGEKQEANTHPAEESGKQTEETCAAPELRKETVVSPGDSVSDSISNLNLDEETKQNYDEKGQEETPKDSVDSKTDGEETESCSDSGEEFDDETVDEFMKEASEEQKDGPREEEESSEDEEEQDKVDEEELKERDATLTEEEKEVISHWIVLSLSVTCNTFPLLPKRHWHTSFCRCKILMVGVKLWDYGHDLSFPK